MLLTNLANHAQPILRYNLGDRIAVNPEPCACGSPSEFLSRQGLANVVVERAAEPPMRDPSI